MNAPVYPSNPSWPAEINSVDELEDLLSVPAPGAVEAVRGLQGDIMVLGIGGKMGPTLARQLRRALDAAGNTNKVFGVSRFSDAGLRDTLENWGIHTVAGDLLDRETLAGLPDAKTVFYLPARKFGSTGDEEYTWAMNTHLAALACERYPDARFVALSTGNVYPLVPVTGGGSREEDGVEPVGEYAQSCVGRERMFQYFSRKNGATVSVIRLNYAAELRYGILLDIAQKVYARIPVSVSMGNVNVIWQGDANAYIIQAAAECASPPRVINVTGPETLSVRALAHRFGARFGIEPVIEGDESPTALLNNAANAFQRFGYPRVPVGQLMQWVARWIEIEGPVHNKPTHFEERKGRF